MAASGDEKVSSRYFLDNFGAEEGRLLKSKVARLDFDAFLYNSEELTELVSFMFLDLGCLDYFHIHPKLMQAVVTEIAKGYGFTPTPPHCRTVLTPDPNPRYDDTVPFHNFLHGVDTCQMIYYLLITTQGRFHPILPLFKPPFYPPFQPHFNPYFSQELPLPRRYVRSAPRCCSC